MKPLHEIFDQPACEHNRAKGKRRNAGCPKPEPGSAMGGCAFDGAQITLLPIADVLHLVHGPSACLSNSWEARGSLSSGPEMTWRGFMTDLSEQEIIFGGEKKLEAAIHEAVRKFAPPAVFVYSTCVTALIGEDLEAVCAKASRELDLPVVPVNSPGFIGSKNLGNRMAGEALLEYVIGTREPEVSTPYDVNLVGEYNIAGELWQMKPLFEEAGIRILASITGDGRFGDIRTAHRAKATMVVCGRALINLAQGLLDRYGIPYFEGSFYGIRETGEALRNFGRILGGEVPERVEGLIKREEARLDHDLRPYREILKGKKALLYTGGVKSWAFISALQDLGMEVVATSSRKSTMDDVAKMKSLLGESGVIMEEGGPKVILKTMRELGAHILLAGGRNQYTAVKGRVPFIDVNQERHRPYAGYEGMRRLAQDLALELTHPVYRQIAEGDGRFRKGGVEAESAAEEWAICKV
ncbi:nitrogenase iron-molybdenum cofactor biosynthesis protein NifE [Kyrpidia spormannii]|uniref:Nitrogenase iron-molybdenum cofactor biosynthesis protein n=2 Tax=Kyrpidia spormannii TaxID=2055160 RepID=A0ACA8Z9I6_9BACL|nr:nitrogenase iron-molybdenum cofactor biosynthesis protein NifE [Kyrpidia spormannii]CAB3392192.1 Nitrogenase iron-molybdenum cofactor biosynthesis protein [Kyrpidia spormannii]CAB3393114.1 Nitrogenase iron-molybdenum cofactor biosynthesis protein NifE [Kyrpidia spormannii]